MGTLQLTKETTQLLWVTLEMRFSYVLAILMPHKQLVMYKVISSNKEVHNKELSNNAASNKELGNNPAHEEELGNDITSKKDHKEKVARNQTILS